MFTTFQLASVLQHCVYRVSGPCSLSMCGGHIQEILHMQICNTQTKENILFNVTKQKNDSIFHYYLITED